MLTVPDMIRQMQIQRGTGQPRPFALTFCTANRNTGTGGEIRHLRRAILLRPEDGRRVLVQPVGTREVLRLHTDLILTFNEQPVA